MKEVPYFKELKNYAGMFKSACVVFDPAHGEDVAGKRSPDGKHREYKWSRERIEGIIDLLNKLKGFMIKSPFLDEPKEPGLVKRVKTYNEICGVYDLVIMLSLHNDALKNPPAFWSGPGGFTFFTDRGETMADTIVDYMGNVFKESLPKETFRFDYALGPNEKIKDKDREADFMVIHGYKSGNKLIKAKYAGILIENNFMDVRTDLAKLMDKDWNKALEFVYFDSIARVMREIGLTNYINPVTVKP